MGCFQFNVGEKRDEEPKTPRRVASIRSSSTTSNDREPRRSGSEFSLQTVSDISTDSFPRIYFHNSSLSQNNLTEYTFSELKSATRNFSRSHMIGEGGFGCVYRGTIRCVENPSSKIDIAVKQLCKRGSQGHKEWMNEVNILGVINHPNLVRLIGYCAEDDERGKQRLLVYEFMPNRSVEDQLSARSSKVLSWVSRLKIALDAACGLMYLHEELDFQIIFRDLKTSNILLDKDWNAKLSDFGLAKQCPVDNLGHISTKVAGTIGYVAPEYIHTGRLTTKSDVWSYGVVLYELITGRRPMDMNRPKGEQKMLDWVKLYISESKKFHLIMDPRLQGQYPLKSAKLLAMVANKCLVRNPKSRPKMSEVLVMVRNVIDTSNIASPRLAIKTNDDKDVDSKLKRKKSSFRKSISRRISDGRRNVPQSWTRVC